MFFLPLSKLVPLNLAAGGLGKRLGLKHDPPRVLVEVGIEKLLAMILERDFEVAAALIALAKNDVGSRLGQTVGRVLVRNHANLGNRLMAEKNALHLDRRNPAG